MSTFARPTSDLVIPVGVFIAGDVRVLFVRVCVPVVVASMLVSAIPCTAVVSASCVAIAAEMASVAEITFQLPSVLAGDADKTYVVPVSD